MAFQKIADAVRQSLWFVPALWVIACGLAAIGLVAVDNAVGDDIGERIPLVFGGGPDAARVLLSAIASSMITVVGVVFSITIVALQLASSQYSPRVLRNFMRDRPSQMTLGSFIGAFVYSLLVLRTVRNGSEERDEFVPVFAVTGAVVLAVVAVGMLVYFIHHIATRMQAAHIAATVVKEALDELDRQTRESDAAPRPATREAPPGPGRSVNADRSGYLQYVEIDRLIELAHEHDLVIRVDVAAGQWVQRHARLFEIWGRDQTDDLDDALRSHVSVGDERVVHQDPEFAVQQLVDIGVKALSPGINDPTTARNALHRVLEILVAASRATLTPVEHADGDGRLRVVVPRSDFRRLVRTAFEEITHFGRDIPTVARTISDVLDVLESTVEGDQRVAVIEVRRALDLPDAAATNEG